MNQNIKESCILLCTSFSPQEKTCALCGLRGIKLFFQLCVIYSSMSVHHRGNRCLNLPVFIKFDDITFLPTWQFTMTE